MRDCLNTIFKDQKERQEREHCCLNLDQRIRGLKDARYFEQDFND